MKIFKHFMRIVCGAFCCLMTIAVFFLSFTEKPAVPFIIETVIFAVLTFLLVRDPKRKDNITNQTLVKLNSSQEMESVTKANCKRTLHEENLSANFMMNHSYDIYYHVDKFETLCEKAYSEKNLTLKIELLEQTILEYKKAKKWFYRTKGGMIYFEDMYEHLHNSHNNDFSYIDSVQDELDYCFEKRDIVIPSILSAIGKNGIIQKDIYELVDSDKSNIQRIIRELESENKIIREKKGNSYLLTLN